MKRLFVLLGLTVVCTPCTRALALNAGDLPRPQGWVSDQAGVLNPESKSQLEQFLAQLKEKTGAEVTVATIPTLEGDSLERFSNDLFARWGIGVKGKDNGVLIFLAMREHQIRIEVGYGLEGILPDGLCGRIIREQMAPSFKQGNYSQGVLKGVSAVAQVIADNAGVTLTRPEAIPTVDLSESAPAQNNFWTFLILILIFIFIIRHPFLAFWFLSGSGPGQWGGGGFGNGGGFGGFGGGMSGGGGASGGW